ncbi:MAG TPA: 4-hydroxy-tetrahydrodipicolinate reductase [Dokdonella sp.]|uniref:4-hydroxy-tetrahydrodipicolinate reductase n=1 Tax=Dokdonella sp. TaxID=2291710 RepID=UPI002C4B7AD7|nr:4-hydroxy-tetrahydrodipicolinate reductase [Dokdonella sp.]HUD42762.1 4-hydroxy-tetrahydrodipicolinate reductase [Dokdonella sp.]
MTDTSNPTAVAVFGATGRMGQALVRAIRTEPRARLAAALVRSGSSSAGRVVPDFEASARDGDAERYADRLDAAPAALIEFAGPAGFDAALDLALRRGIAFVSGSTGLSAPQLAALDAAATRIPVLWSANFSLGIAVLTRLVREAAAALADWDCEIVEAHHRHKRDAPSGTALALGRAAAEGRGVAFESVAGAASRSGERRDGEIGFAVVRGGDVVGEHSVCLLGAGERIELGHRATERDIFARGAVRAALWLAGRAPGRYALQDLFTR